MFKGTERETKQSGGRNDQVNGLLDKGCSFEGKLTFDGTMQINGDFKGEIYSDGTLVVGNDAQISAKVFVDTLVVYGKVEGDIEAKNRIEMRVPAVVIAKVNTKTLSVEDGVIFEGQCHMEKSGIEKRETSILSETEFDQAAGTRDSEEDVLVM